MRSPASSASPDRGGRGNTGIILHRAETIPNSWARPPRQSAARDQGAAADGVGTYRGIRAGRPAGTGPRQRAPAVLDQSEAGDRKAALCRGFAGAVLLRVRQTDAPPRAGGAAR